MVIASIHVFTFVSCLLLLAFAEKVEKYISGSNTDVQAALEFLNLNDKLAEDLYNKAYTAEWNYNTDLTDENKNITLRMADELAKFAKETWTNATSFAWKNFKDTNETLYRWFKSLSVLGTAALPEDKYQELTGLLADMGQIYGTVKFCPHNATGTNVSCDINLEPEMMEIFRVSRDYDELKDYWIQWRDLTGKKMKQKFLRYVELNNEAARLNGFEDLGDMWREEYESETFVNDIDDLLKTLQPLYKQLHAYVRRKIIQRYPDKGIRPDGPIPCHLLGDLWGQVWDIIFDVVKPYEGKEFVDVTDAMIKKQMKPIDMFRMSDEFLKSLGLLEMTPDFWNKSVIVKPKDKEMVCHASAWDLHKKGDVRIKMCTRVNMEDLGIVHHEMGHIEYFLQYADQPVVFRNGANSGFHEAAGDTIALSVMTPKHMKKIGLLEELTEDVETDINFLMKMALQKVAVLPAAYILDFWRWKVFKGEIDTDDLNSKWWEYRLNYQGVCPPVRRTKEDLDPASIFHTIADVDYVRYFVSFVIQFQFHKSLCDAAGHQGPYYKCDIYQSLQAGELLSNMMKIGSSKHWSEAMRIITNGATDKMDIRPMMDYFEPLLRWLENENKNEILGWASEDPMICPGMA